uniref:Protein MAK10 homolog n=1 Tax=Schistocephalus solidus TaxID=70667 RepID=A0A0V0J6D3_SCHSO
MVFPLGWTLPPTFRCAHHQIHFFSLSDVDLNNILIESESELAHADNGSATCKAIVHRIRFVRLYHSALCTIAPLLTNKIDCDFDDLAGVEDVCYDASYPSQNAQSLLNLPLSMCSLKNICEYFKVLIEDIASVCKDLNETVSLGAAPGPGKHAPRIQEYGLPGFEPFLTQANLPSAVQKNSKILDRNLAFYFLSCAFLRIKSIIPQVQRLLEYNSFSFVSFQELWSFLHTFGQKCCQSVCEKTINCDPSSGDTGADSFTCLLSRSVLSVLVSAFFHCYPKLPDGLQFKLGASQSATHLLFSWVCIESPSVRKQLLNHLPVLEKFNSFFDHVGSQLVAISRGFCFNRSRQRSNMEQIFSRMHELLEDSCNIENALVSALTESQGADPPNHLISHSPSPSLTLHLAAYVCFFYYHLAWDYVGTGFQLGLYSCHEWVYMYSFEINIFRSLTSLLQHIITPWLRETEAGAGAKSSIEVTNQNASNVVGKRSGRRRRRKAHEGQEASQVTTDCVSPSLLVDLDACAVGLDYWKYQMELANMHRFICAATIYVLRAFQHEVGIDLNSLEHGPVPFTPGQRRFYGSLRTQFIRRLGSLISSPTSPLADPGGVLAAFRSAHEYLVMGHFAECSTTDLYQLASKIYGVARQCLRNAESLLAKLRSSGSFYSPESGLLPLGPVDSLAEVDHLAKNNYVVARLLAARPEKRPSAKQLPANRPPDLRSPLLSVRLDFTFLPSRMYPLLRLAS